jgi:LmbE family N-acetylglucosaminyl deacetylase
MRPTLRHVPDHSTQLRILCIGAHPDDCEIHFGGTAAKFADLGHAVKFLALTNGEAGHAVLRGPELAVRRARESEEAAGRLGIAATEVLQNHDGELVPDIETRWEIVRQIRRWDADIVLTHRPYDYHPDHRYTSQLVQDSAYLVVVPNVCRDVPALVRNPVYLYLEDHFRKPAPFTADVAVDIDEVWERKIDTLDAHASQVYEWLPWVDGRADEVPVDAAERRRWLSDVWTRVPCGGVQAALQKRYGSERARTIEHAEAFELCEYGRRPPAGELDEMFPR